MEASGNQAQTVAVLGLGYVGCVTAACLASLGHRVIGADKDQHKVANVLGGEAPFFEPGLSDIVRDTVARGLLTATTSTGDALRDADIALVCVGTPSEKNGNLGLEQLRRVMADIAAGLDDRARPLIIAIRSTVYPGTCEELTDAFLAGRNNVVLISNPEFLREGTAIRDFNEPSLVVVGGEPAAVARVAALYAPLGVTPCLVSLRTAEMIKYACNAFHAVKIAFANEIGAMSDRLGVDGREVMDTLCRDERLNISRAYLKLGFAVGGSCLPKDLRAIVYRAGRLDLQLPLLGNTLLSNDEHLRRAINDVLDLPGPRLGIVGLAFKENTDDLRESPVVTMLEQLIGKGRDLRVFDPHIRLSSIYGSNREYLLRALPHISRLLADNLDDLLAWADCIVVTQKPSAAAAERIAASGRPVLDLIDGSLTRTPVSASAAL